MKNVLVLSPFFFPEPISTGKYNTLLASALVSRGVHVDVIASHPLYPNWKPKITTETLDGIRVHRGGARIRYSSNPLIRRTLLELWFAIHVLVRLQSIKKRDGLPDTVLPIFPPSFFFLGCMSLLPSKVKKIGIVHDLQGVYASQKRGALTGLLKKAIHLVEGKAFSGCDKLIFLSREMMQEAINSYRLDRGACQVIYPPASLNPDAANIGNELGNIFPDGYKHIVYAGALGEKQDPGQLIDLFLSALDSLDGIMFHVFSSGPTFENIKNRYAEKTKFIQFHDLLPESQLRELYARSYVQIVPQRAGTSKGSLPSKLPNLISTGVRILGIVDSGSELADLLSKVEGAVAINSWEKEEFIKGLISLFDDERSHDERKNANRDMLLQSFSIEPLVDAIIQT